MKLRYFEDENQLIFKDLYQLFDWNESAATERVRLIPKPPQLPDNMSEFKTWLLRSGLSTESSLGVSRSGIYTDFT